jgi:hypothetical protein
LDIEVLRDKQREGVGDMATTLSICVGKKPTPRPSEESVALHFSRRNCSEEFVLDSDLG